MKHRLLLSAVLLSVLAPSARAQRVVDKLQRGIVAVPVSGGNLVSWRILGEEYYDTQYNLYRNGTKLNSTPLSVSNYKDTGGGSSAVYQVEPVVRGVAQQKSESVKAWANSYLDVPVAAVIDRAGNNLTSGYSLNDVSVGDMDGDGQMELVVKRRNDYGSDTQYGVYNSANKTAFHRYECYKLDGTLLWYIDLGPNMLSGPDEQWDLIVNDWDEDGRCEALMRAADNMIIHTAAGKTINIGNMNYYAPRSEYTHHGTEYLLYMNGATGEPYGWDGASEGFTPMPFPLPRFEAGEAANVNNATDAEYAKVWGEADTGHRSLKIYMGAPYLDGRHASIFLGRGCYTRHKMCALDVNPDTHELTQRWRWNCYDGTSPWFGNGFHNFAIADVDMDGRDEIVFGSMVIDDTGCGLSTDGLGHGDAQHCADLDPYRWGLEQFTCQEGAQGMSYRNATTAEMYYRKSDGGDDGRALAGNFFNEYPGGQGRSVSSGILGLSSDRMLPLSAGGSNDALYWSHLNCRIYWDGDLLDEVLDSPGTEREAAVYKPGGGRLFTSSGCAMDNSSKNNPAFMGDILGDWREEIVVRTSNNSSLRIYTTTTPTTYGIYTLWHDHVYRNGMVWQPVGYNQPPHLSFFLGELEGITVAPPPLILTGRTEVKSGETIDAAMNGQHLLFADYGDATVSVADGAAPHIFTDNAPQWVKGNDRNGSSKWNFHIDYEPYTHTLTGGAFTGDMRLVKQGEGKLVLPDVVQTYTGETNVWNGTLEFSGTLQSSPLWLNRHTTLLTDGGRFMGGLKADYNATIYVGKDKKSTLETTTLQLGFGARLVLDLYGDHSADLIKAERITIEQKTWQYGPKYSVPVLQFQTSGEVADGEYLIAEAAAVSGNADNVTIDDIVLEGINGKRHYLKYADGKLCLVVESFRQGDTITWNGTQGDNTWDYGATENFLLADGTATYNGEGDNVVFNDQAAFTVVKIKGAVRPASVLFDNTKNYILQGDSIVGSPTLTKNGSGNLTVQNLNKTGNVVINGGKVTASLLANNSGQSVGSLGTVASDITINSGGVFSVNGTAITDQQLRVHGSTFIDLPTGSSLTLNKATLGDGTLTKQGAGSLTLGAATQGYDTLVVAAGTVNARENGSAVVQLPQTVVLQGGTLFDPASENSYSTNNANFVVPEGKTGTFFGDPRCEYHGRLTGSGTFIVYGTWVRCYYKGDWSQFEGTITPRVQDRSTKGGYDPSFDFDNANGLPNATLNLEDGFTFTSHSAMEIGAVTGTGTLGGTNAYTLGTNNKDFRVTFNCTAPIIKKGTGNMTIGTAGKIKNAVTVNEGELRFSHSSMTTLEHGTYATVVNNGGTVRGTGLLNSLTAYNGSDVYPMVPSSGTPAKLKVNNIVRFNAGANLHLTVRSNASCSQLLASMFTMNGNVVVELLDSYQPAAGDSLQLWTISNTVAGTPVLQLPELPAGLYWDTTSLIDAAGKPMKNGVLLVTDDEPMGIAAASASVERTYSVYSLAGTYLCTVSATEATLRQALGRRLNGRRGTEAVIVRSDGNSRKLMLK
ncbi:MAG: carbohydrate-binding protein [Prevotella sp.]|nr:carbohydrate-binding protein [Prevotella sp.]